MGVKNQQRKFWKIFIGGLSLVIVLATSAGRWIPNFRWEEEPEWANVDGLIPAVQYYDFDSTGWNLISQADFILDSMMGTEAYRITSSPDGIMITHGELGDYRAQATLTQLGLLGHESVVLPYGTIEDAPAFAHRGVLLDVGRHFFKVPEIKRHLDVMALYKFNVFHWHLTEDQGWRIAIEAYPKLTEVGGWRTYGDSVYGGYYSKDELLDVVAYASGLGIEVIPEIEMPGHSQAALAAYPELGCTGDSIGVATDWGVFKDIYCAGNEQTFDFLEAVLDEVCEIFSSKFIHIGGDEAPKFRWEHCAKCQVRLAVENLENTEELQRYFITRIEDYNLPFFGMIALNFIFPLLLLMNSDYKRVNWFIVMTGIIILIGHYIDVFNMIMPATVGDQWFFGIPELSGICFFGGLFIYVVFNSLSKAPLEPSGDPLIKESEKFVY